MASVMGNASVYTIAISMYVCTCMLVERHHALCCQGSNSTEDCVNSQFSLPLRGCIWTEGAPSRQKKEITLSLEHCKTQLACPCSMARISPYFENVNKIESTLYA